MLPYQPPLVYIYGSYLLHPDLQKIINSLVIEQMETLVPQNQKKELQLSSTALQLIYEFVLQYFKMLIWSPLEYLQRWRTPYLLFEYI